MKKITVKASNKAYWKGKQRLNLRTNGENDYSSGIRKQKPIYHYNYAKAIKIEVFGHYSGEKIFCACCGESELDFLCMDHINGGGNKHRRELGGIRGCNLWRWLRDNNYPNGFQVLCHNCNFAKDHTREKTCPHRRTITYNKPL